MENSMEGIIAILTAPIFVFLIFVAPIWIILHYRSRNKINAGLNDEERASLQQLADSAQRMQDRIKTLEAILESDHPNWRRTQGDRTHDYQ